VESARNGNSGAKIFSFFLYSKEKPLIIDLPDIVDFPENFYQSDVKPVLQLLILPLRSHYNYYLVSLTTYFKIMIWMDNN